ncbi:hypothetical protein [uncultured Algibacter sp.]|uniref:hypothetical protein n=1 Tax=uncultured Algibacter sp. TaxID=298659 RepID=UPI002608EFAE|nr:hypothetical protein [uncultured Algibacter sp.]
MKYTSTLYFLIFIIYSCTSGGDENTSINSCDNGTIKGEGTIVGITLSTQKEVDDFGNMCYTSIDGGLYINGENSKDPITSLKSLRNLKHIVNSLANDNLGGLTIHKTDIKSLEGLENLTSSGLIHIDKNSYLEDISSLSNLSLTRGFGFSFNPKLKSLNGIQNSHIKSYFSIAYCNSLKNLPKFKNISSSLISLDINDNESLTSIEGLENLTQISDDGLGIKIINNINLASLKGLDNLKHIHGYFTIENNISLKNLNALSNLENVKENLIILSNQSLNTLNGLNSLTMIDDLMIANNNSLTSLEGLNNLISADILSIGMYWGVSSYPNTKLKDFCALQNLFTTGSYGIVKIQYNAYNPTVSDIQSGNCNN